MFGRVTFSVAVVSCCVAAAAYAQQQKIGAPPEASNMKLVGTNDLQARSAYQPTVHHQGDRYIAYIGHHGGTDDIPDPINPLTGKAEPNGTSIVDVTDPAHPKYLKHIPGQEGKYESGGAQMVRVCDGKGLPKGDPNAVYMLRAVGSDGHEIWNVADPANPILVSKIGQGLKDTHKNFWECDTGIAYLVSGVPEWRTRRMTEVYDLSDPAHPQKIRDFGLPGRSRVRPAPYRPSCTARSRRGRRATGSISATAPTRAACCRSSTATSCSTAPRSRRRRTSATRRSGGSPCRRRTGRTRRSRCRTWRSPSSPTTSRGATATW